ncbi:MAG: YdcF family protein [Acidobacteriota bacterium]|nr:YdcF family protein [Acidobacteriota bacterium]
MSLASRWFSRRRLKAVGITLGIFAALLGLAWWQRAPLLRGVAHLYIVSDSPAPADAIVILGGGVELRSLKAAELYHAGFAKQILVMQPERTELNTLGLIVDQAELAIQLLKLKNVPDSAIVRLEREVTSTLEEADALAAWAQANNAHSLLVTTDIFHTRRARWILNRKLQAIGVDVRMMAVPQKKYSADNWWQTEAGVIDFQNEVIKFALYRWRF